MRYMIYPTDVGTKSQIHFFYTRNTLILNSKEKNTYPCVALVRMVSKILTVQN